MKLKLNDVGPMGNVNIEISKINVVGGTNSSGKSTVSKLLYCYFKSQNEDESFDYLMDNEGLSKDLDVVFEDDLNMSEVFYIDNISILDLKDLDILRVDHIIHIKEALEVSEKTNESEILSKIENIIGKDCLNTTSSGIKDIGIIQILLKNNQLKENSFLIIDEPESSLHPEWQIKFAEILVLLAKDLNIHLYLNSNSPMFIEAISVYAQYYNLLNETNFYLTYDINGKYDFIKINPKNMGEIYENLTKPYDILDKLMAKILFKE
ncbi:MAG: ATP-binding protein [Methanobrevibacter sp.]|uniref:AAA family ATPase n=1 Tax=Methanobrevibacter sp. TaxID=66852 RepID=UPI0025D9B1AA|nr:AAA family ATPase [Methanobrevibacter sp.]MBE6507918.1 ATP-binding protein [Methanobrevibacter sp.]